MKNTLYSIFILLIAFNSNLFAQNANDDVTVHEMSEDLRLNAESKKISQRLNNLSIEQKQQVFAKQIDAFYYNNMESATQKLQTLTEVHAPNFPQKILEDINEDVYSFILESGKISNWIASHEEELANTIAGIHVSKDFVNGNDRKK